MHRKKIITEVLKVLADESNKRGVDRIRRLLHQSEKWLKENKQQAEKALYESLEKAIDLKLEEITKTLAPGDRFARIELVSSKLRIEDALAQNLDKEMKTKLEEFQIPFKKIAEDKKIQSWFKEILEKNGFEITSKGAGGGYDKLEDALAHYYAYIWWSVPFYFEYVDKNIDWGHVYDLIQLVTFYKHVPASGNAIEKFHEKKLEEYYAQLKAILGDVSVADIEELKKVHAEEFKDWEKKWLKPENAGKKPKTLRLGSPFEIAI